MAQMEALEAVAVVKTQTLEVPVFLDRVTAAGQATATISLADMVAVAAGLVALVQMQVLRQKLVVTEALLLRHQ
jgi:hypothetical protein